MAALDFPPSSESPFIAPNGVVYVWNDDGFWEADTSEVPTSDNTFLKLDASNDPVTGSLNITGDLDITGKMTSASTGAGDGGTTVVTKDFIDGNGGTGSIGYWDRSGTSLSPVNGGDSVLIGGTAADPSIVLNAAGYSSFDKNVKVRTDGSGTLLQADGSVNQYYYGTDGSTVALVKNDGSYAIGGVPASAPNISLNEDGNIEAENIALGGMPVAGLGTAPGAKLRGSGDLAIASEGEAIQIFNVPDGGTPSNANETFRLRNDGTVYIGGTISSAPNISLFNHGGAEFNGAAAFRRNNPTINQAYFIAQDSSDNKVKLLASQESLYLGNDVQATAGNPISGANITLNADGFYTSKSQYGHVNLNVQSGALLASPDGNKVNATCIIAHDGSAEFAGIVTSDRPVSGTPANTWACF